MEKEGLLRNHNVQLGTVPRAEHEALSMEKRIHIQVILKGNILVQSMSISRSLDTPSSQLGTTSELPARYGIVVLDVLCVEENPEKYIDGHASQLAFGSYQTDQTGEAELVDDQSISRTVHIVEPDRFA